MNGVLNDIGLKEEYESGMSTVQLGKKYECSSVTIGNHLKKIGVELTGVKISLSVTNLELKKEYESGISQRNLAEKYNTTRTIIKNRLKEIGCEMRNVGKVNSSGIPLPITNLELKEEYESGMSTIQLGEKYGYSNTAIAKRLKNVGCQLRDAGGSIILNVTDLELKIKYESGMEIKELAKKYKCTSSVISRRLYNVNCKIRSTKFKFPITDIELKEEYESGNSGTLMAEKYGCSIPTMYTKLKFVGCKIKTGNKAFVFPITNSELIKEYESGLSTNEMAKKYGCANSTVYNKFVSMGYIFPKMGENITKNLSIGDIELVKEYESGSSLKDIGDKYGVCTVTIYNKLKKIGCEIRSTSAYNEVILPITDIELKKEYESGLSLKDIANKYNCTSMTIKKRLENMGCNRRGFGDANKMELVVSDLELKEEYESGLDSIELAEKYECSYTTILNRLKNIGCKIRGIKGENHPNWDGGISQKYCYKFDASCRERNRVKYDRECFICGKPESENITITGKQIKLAVHHIDRNKNQGCDNTEWALIPVCLKHHAILHNDLWESRITWLLDNIEVIS